jgi:predicted O-methyltransferase YrrM
MECSGFGLLELIKDINNPVGVEIGSAEGDTTEFLLSNHSSLNLTSIDPYVEYVDWNGNNIVRRETSLNYLTQRLEKFKDRFKLIQMFSDDAVDLIEDESLDFIFIDGLHTYDQVTKDCNNYYSKVKSGGIFAGHDYHVINEVGKAVDEFAAKFGVEISHTKYDVWYWVKP